jgi:hypothetical protein
VQAIAPRLSPSELDTGSYISSPRTTESTKSLQEKALDLGVQFTAKEASLLLARFVPRGGIRCKGSFPASRRVGQASASFFCGLLLLSMQSFAELTRSLDPVVTQLSFGQLDRSQSLLEWQFSWAF